jgi:hypothetical protein
MSPRLFRQTRVLGIASLAAAAIILVGATSALATFPGRNGLIAFHSATATEGTQIFTVRPNGRDLRQITTSPAMPSASTGRPMAAGSRSRSTRPTAPRPRS